MHWLFEAKKRFDSSVLNHISWNGYQIVDWNEPGIKARIRQWNTLMERMRYGETNEAYSDDFGGQTEPLTPENTLFWTKASKLRRNSFVRPAVQAQKTACNGHTAVILLKPMKVAVSIPDALFKSAESLAKRLKKPRSRLYAEALASYLSSHDPKAITENLNQVYSQHSSAIDPAFEKAQAEVLTDETW